MVKSKNDVVDAGEEPAHTRPNKKQKVSNTGVLNEGIELNSDGGCAASIAPITEATKDDQDKPKNSSMEPNPSENVTSFESVSPAVVPKWSGGATQATLTIWTVIPNPTKLLIEETEVKDYEDALKLRLYKLSNYTNQKANVKILCDPATGEPVTIWVVGHITCKWFARQGKPENQASINIMPLSQNLVQQSAHLLAKLSTPVLSVNQQEIHNIRAIKWQNTKNNDVQTEAILFNSVYDARGVGWLKNYDERPLWSITDLKVGDLILLEMRMTWWSRKGEDNKW
ncbi:hypothetical protein F4604DRAFT_1919982 [Suillus subluteus]|nr:hypothetical protein F4604DRAFT_1919982 [Suillus subluteus]